MTTVATLIADIRRDLLSGTREARNILATTIDADDTAVVCTYDTAGIAAGTVISVGLEDLYVWAVDNATKTLTVSRGEGATTAAAATSGAEILINAEYTPARCLSAINDELASLSAEGLYAVRVVELTTSASQWTYNLTGVTDLIDVLRVYTDTSGAENEWPEVRNWTLRRNQETDEFASGFALRVDEYLDSSEPLRIIYSAPFTALSTLAQDLTTNGGLRATAVDIVKLGTQARLMGVYESKRAQTAAQGDTRRAAEVRPGAALQSASALLRLRDRRVNQERARLMSEFPPRRR